MDPVAIRYRFKFVHTCADTDALIELEYSIGLAE